MKLEELEDLNNIDQVQRPGRTAWTKHRASR